MKYNLKIYSSQTKRNNDQPIEWPDGYKEWWFNGKRHRTDGPARFWPPRSMFRSEYFFNGEILSKEEWFLKLNQQQKHDAIWNM